jgi:hypothetical protein
MQYVQEHSNGIPSEHAHQPIIRTQSNAGRIAAGLQDARLKQASRGREIHLYSGPARAASPSSSPLMYCAAASNPGLPSCSSSSKSVSSHHTSKKHKPGAEEAYLAARDVYGEAAEVLEHAALGEGLPRRVGLQRGDVAHVDEPVGEEGHGGVQRGQREQHARGLRSASSSYGGRAPARWRAGCHRRRRQVTSRLACWWGDSERRGVDGGPRDPWPLRTKKDLTRFGGWGCFAVGAVRLDVSLFLYVREQDILEWEPAEFERVQGPLALGHFWLL